METVTLLSGEVLFRFNDPGHPFSWGHWFYRNPRYRFLQGGIGRRPLLAVQLTRDVTLVNFSWPAGKRDLFRGLCGQEYTDNDKDRLVGLAHGRLGAAGDGFTSVESAKDVPEVVLFRPGTVVRAVAVDDAFSPLLSGGWYFPAVPETLPRVLAALRRLGVGEGDVTVACGIVIRADAERVWAHGLRGPQRQGLQGLPEGAPVQVPGGVQRQPDRPDARHRAAHGHRGLARCPRVTAWHHARDAARGGRKHGGPRRRNGACTREGPRSRGPRGPCTEGGHARRRRPAAAPAAQVRRDRRRPPTGAGRRSSPGAREPAMTWRRMEMESRRRSGACSWVLPSSHSQSGIGASSIPVGCEWAPRAEGAAARPAASGRRARRGLRPGRLRVGARG